MKLEVDSPTVQKALWQNFCETLNRLVAVSKYDHWIRTSYENPQQVKIGRFLSLWLLIQENWRGTVSYMYGCL